MNDGRFKKGHKHTANWYKVVVGRISPNKGIKTGPNPKASLALKGRIPWNKGLTKADPRVAQYTIKRALAMTGRKQTAEHIRKRMKNFYGKNHFAWRDDKAGYEAKHNWVKRWFGKADRCEAILIGLECRKISAVFQWANISKKYLRVREDWIMLCVSCHKRYDYPKGNRTIFKKGHKYFPHKNKLFMEENSNN